ncbi:MAG: DUF4962 domain-containing protein [Desulfocapsaceae bacterium]|nr:DUF4962 domain-containing protein [Desulfocapsaceae bacterium]
MLVKRLLFVYMAIVSTWTVVCFLAYAEAEKQDVNGYNMEVRSSLAMPFAPEDGTVVRQTPPDFSWPFQEKTSSYQFRLNSSTDAEEMIVGNNWLNWPHMLPAGKYSWQVRAVKSAGVSSWSAMRYFTVPADAYNFVVPSAQILLNRIKQTPRPRTFPRGEAQKILKTIIGEDRAEGWKQLLSRVQVSSKLKLTEEPPIPANSLETIRDQRFMAREIRDVDTPETWRMLNAAFVYLISRDAAYLKEARRRALNLASWDPQGSTGFSSNDILCRDVAFSLAVVYDWLFDKFEPQEKAVLARSINVRMTIMYKRYIEDKRLAEMPYDSHGWVTLGRMAVIAAIMEGETGEAEAWVKDTIPLYFFSIAPWGGDDGGFGNGSSYGGSDYRTSLLVWDMLLQSTGVNLYQKPWVQNFLNFMVYCLPPGTPAGIFGDGAERKKQGVWAQLAACYALRIPSKLSNWYVNNQTGADFSLFNLISAMPVPDIPANVHPSPPVLPNAIYFPSIGWSAMHSDLADQNRISVYFKSSPYGSFNHSHADQNSFVINADGKALAIDSGYYDWYGSPHWKHWYKQTQAHNAITFDDGKGQEINDKGAAGKIISFAHDEKYDVVVGDATRAYKSEINKARRTLAYIRPGTVVIYDKLTSENSRSWEWNIHALYKMEQTGKQTVKIENQGSSLCIQILKPRKVSFTQTDQFTEPVDIPGKQTPNQWHGRFFCEDKMKNSEFLVVLQVNCQANKIVDDDVTFQNNKYVLTLNNATVSIGEDGAEVFPLTH